MKLSRTFLLSIILFVFVASVSAQENSYDIITHEDELYGKTIGPIFIGSDGKLWMSGTGEVSRLNGDTWMTFTTDEELSDKEIQPRAVSSDGVIWCSSKIGSGGGFLTIRFDGETWTTFSLTHEGKNLSITYIVVDPDGVAWAAGGVLNGAVFYYKDDTWTKTIVDFALGNVIQVYDLTVDLDGVVYAATNGGVYKHEDGKWENTDLVGMEQDDAFTLTVVPDGKVWVGTYRGNVSRFDGESWITIVESNDITWRFNAIKDTFLKYIINKEKEYYEQHSEYINFEFGEDCDPIGWKAAMFSLFEFSFQDSIASAREKEDQNGDGDTADGLTLSVTGIKGNITGSDVTWETMFGEGPSGYHITNMEVGSYGEIWLNTTYGQLFWYDDGTWIKYTDDDIQSNQSTYISGVAHDGVTWFGSRTYKVVWQLIPTPTSVETDKNIPSEFTINGNYPNPFNPTTTIEFTIPETGFINLSIYNITGQKIRELVADTITVGTHSVTWDGRDENGMMVSSGIYLSRLKSREHVAAGRMLLMK